MLAFLCDIRYNNEAPGTGFFRLQRAGLFVESVSCSPRAVLPSFLHFSAEAGKMKIEHGQVSKWS